VSKEIENILRKLNETIERFYPEDVKIDYKKYLEKSGLINLLNNQLGSLTFLIDIKNLRVIHMSGSIADYTGYEIEEFGDNIMAKFMSFLAPEHVTFLSVFISWSLNVLKTLPIESKSKQYISAWGVKLIHKSQRNMKWYINVVPLEFNNERNPTFIVLTIQEVTHLIKGDDYIIRAAALGETNKKIFVYYSNEDKTSENDIISEREREVLHHISQGLDTKQIAILMNISPNTVDNHRRNMLARTGTRDTTALIQLCKMIGVV
jgi:DNA-binding CsgD family transcriptional regulator